MNIEKIREIISDFENAHPVDEYMAYGFRVWPILRVDLGDKLYRFSKSNPPRDFVPSPPPTLRKRFTRIFGRHIFNARDRFLDLTSPVLPEADIIILTYPDRVMEINSQVYNYTVDPLARKLEERGRHTRIWQLGEPYARRAREPIWISAELERERHRIIRSRVLPEKTPPPDWFNAFAGLTRTHFGRPITWSESEYQIRDVVISSLTFGKWFKRVSNGLLILDCWSNLKSMAATMAAKHLGIPTLDFQHGVNGPPYFGWKDAPSETYEVFPEMFWTWGQDSTTTLLIANNGSIPPSAIITGGNLWTNMWRQLTDPTLKEEVSRAKGLSARYEKTILITLQGDIDIESKLRHAIEQGPSDWLWLIRVHRQTPAQLDVIADSFDSLRHKGVLVREATALPLYALLQASDCHITGYSTCAMEALAFDVPTVLLHPSGPDIYGRFIENGSMCYIDRREDLLPAIMKCQEVPRVVLQESADMALAPSVASDAALEAVLAIVRGERVIE
ncbi:hypothetical protein ACFL1X_05720 [Candidatus Hydrogenedentota bacterium]